MHDIDSTRLEASPEHNELEARQEFESYESSSGQEETFEVPMTESEEEALAAELLGVSNEAELEQFLGGLFRKVKSHLGGAAKFLAQNSGPLAAALKGIAAKALPFLGGALGTAIPIPGLGTAIGAAAGNAASKLLQSEMENMEVEEQEFEMARRYVRLASHAMRRAGRIPPRGNPSAVANFVLRNTFRRFRGRHGFRRPNYYRYRHNAPCPPCPLPEPCPACPTCAQPLPGPDAPSTDTTPPPTPTPPSGTTGEFEFEDANEFEVNDEFENSGEFEANHEFENSDEFENDSQGEGENYENDNEAYSAAAPRRGRWVRRGRRIILYL